MAWKKGTDKLKQPGLHVIEMKFIYPIKNIYCFLIAEQDMKLAKKELEFSGDGIPNFRKKSWFL